MPRTIMRTFTPAHEASLSFSMISLSLTELHLRTIDASLPMRRASIWPSISRIMTLLKPQRRHQQVFAA